MNGMFNRCHHKWDILSETITESKMESAIKLCGLPQTGAKTSAYFFEKKHIQVFTCNLCGKFERFVEDI